MIYVVGVGFVGLTTALGFAKKNFIVTAVENNKKKIKLLTQNKITFDEPFLKEMNRINGMGLGFNITVSEELDDYPDISSHVKGKELVFFTFEDGGSNYILVISKDTYKDKKRVISNAFNGSGGFWLSSNVLLRNFPVQKILGSNIKFNLISDDMLNKLFVDSKKIK
jgi:hypothetical protein